MRKAIANGAALPDSVRRRERLEGVNMESSWTLGEIHSARKRVLHLKLAEKKQLPGRTMASTLPDWPIVITTGRAGGLMKALKGHYPRDVSVVLVDVDVIVHVDVIAPVRWPTRKTSTSTTTSTSTGTNAGNGRGFRFTLPESRGRLRYEYYFCAFYPTWSRAI